MFPYSRTRTPESWRLSSLSRASNRHPERSRQPSLARYNLTSFAEKGYRKLLWVQNVKSLFISLRLIFFYERYDVVSNVLLLVDVLYAHGSRYSGRKILNVIHVIDSWPRDLINPRRWYLRFYNLIIGLYITLDL